MNNPSDNESAQQQAAIPQQGLVSRYRAIGIPAVAAAKCLKSAQPKQSTVADETVARILRSVAE